MAVIPDDGVNLYEIVHNLQKDYIVTALDRCLWKKASAAKLLGLERSTLIEKMRKYGLPLLPSNNIKKDKQNGSRHEGSSQNED